MGLSRLQMRRHSGALFWKLCGSGTGEGFTPRPNWGVWAILAVWPDEAAARAAVSQGPVYAAWQGRAAQSWTLLLRPTSARGSWSGVNPFLPDAPLPSHGAPSHGSPAALAAKRPPSEPAARAEAGAGGAGPIVALTRATVRPLRALRFWNRVPGISAVIGSDPNVAFKIGIGEVPLLHQVTVSVWPDAASMAAFARGNGPHGQAIRAVRDGNWFAEELYARFSLLGTLGSWGTGDPLARLCQKKDAA